MSQSPQSTSTVAIEIADRVTPELEQAFARLLPQLSSSGKLPTRAQMEEMVGSPSTPLFVARSDGKIIGILMLVIFRIPTGLRAWIEDVVVDGDARGKGAGEALTRAAIAAAIERGARTVDLTSRPSREAANRLYQRVGFKLRETNFYRYEPPKS
jgi:ribosomal protein S18 acetylase RimI-like enzyme